MEIEQKVFAVLRWQTQRGYSLWIHASIKILAGLSTQKHIHKPVVDLFSTKLPSSKNRAVSPINFRWIFFIRKDSKLFSYFGKILIYVI